jgi:hypothetical protein
MDTALLNRLANIKERVEKLEKVWGIRKSAAAESGTEYVHTLTGPVLITKAAAEIGVQYEGPRVYANNAQQTVAEILATAVANGNESLKRKLLESPAYQSLVANATNPALGTPALRENAQFVVAILERAVEEDDLRRESTPLNATVGGDQPALAETLTKAAALESMKAILTKSTPVGHIDSLDQMRVRREKVRELFYQARKIAAAL